jgi:undecaprenyl diphosphate synthase
MINEDTINSMISSAIPKHVAIIMDGNGRWAQAKNKKRLLGHKKGMKRAKEMVEISARLGIQSLTLFAFSTENWARPEDEVNYLMKLFILALQQEIKMLIKNNVQLKFIGDLSKFSPLLQSTIKETERKTQKNTGLQLSIAANYGGRWDIVYAMNQLLAENNALLEPKQLQKNISLSHDQKIQTQRIDPKKIKMNMNITEAMIQSHLSTHHLPELDVLIRTGGEIRISNFLIWQAAYAELFFTETLWPDFCSTELERILKDYAKRQRRYGQTQEQC